MTKPGFNLGNRQANHPHTDPVIRADSVVLGQNAHDIYVDGRPLSPNASLAVRDHSPNGFAWGYGGSGPAQTALAVLLATGARRETVTALYQEYKWEVIARLGNQDGFVLLGKDIINWLESAKSRLSSTLQENQSA